MTVNERKDFIHLLIVKDILRVEPRRNLHRINNYIVPGHQAALVKEGECDFFVRRRDLVPLQVDPELETMRGNSPTKRSTPTKKGSTPSKKRSTPSKKHSTPLTTIVTSDEDSNEDSDHVDENDSSETSFDPPSNRTRSKLKRRGEPAVVESWDARPRKVHRTRIEDSHEGEEDHESEVEVLHVTGPSAKAL